MVEVRDPSPVLAQLTTRLTIMTAPEIKVLTESINSMKADMLKMKQSHLALEKK